MNSTVVVVVLLVLQVSLVTSVNLLAEDVVDEGSGLTTEESETSTAVASVLECYVCGHYDENMRPEADCGLEKTTYASEGCPSGSNCWIFKHTEGTNVTYARGCYNNTDCTDNAEVQCQKTGETELCKKCCSTDKCNNGKLELSSDAQVAGIHLFTLVAVLATFLLW